MAPSLDGASVSNLPFAVASGRVDRRQMQNPEVKVNGC